MRQKTIFETVDGRQFDNQQQAEDYEDRLFEVWLKDNKEQGDFLRSFANEEKPKAREVLKRFFLWKGGK